MKRIRSLLTVVVLGTTLVLPKAMAITPTTLPPLDQVIEKVKEKAALDTADYHAFNQHYSYRKDRITEFFDSSGKLTDSHEKLSTNAPSPIRVLLQSQRAPAKKIVFRSKATPSEQPNIHGVALGKKEDLLNPDIIKRFKFTLVGREMFNNRSMLVIDFAPVSDDLPVFNIKDRFLNCVEGRVWVDEKDYVMAKADIHLKQKITVLGGVVGSISKFNFTFVRERTADGFWYTRDMGWHVEAHEASFPRVVTQHEIISDVQKAQ